MEENIFEFQFDDDEVGVFNISIVSSPATMAEMIHFSKEEKIEWKLASEEKRILVGPVLIPDQKIYRNNIQGQEGYVFASALTIEKLQQNFSKQRYGNSTNIEHNQPIEGVYVSESWIIENPTIDKSYALGLEYPKGTWMVSMKVENQEVWENYIKTGKLTGFSMEALLSTKKITNNKNQIKMNEEIVPQSIDEIVENAIEEAVHSTTPTAVTAPIEEVPTEFTTDKSMSGDTESYEEEVIEEEVAVTEEMPAEETVPVEEVSVEEASPEELKNQIAVLEKQVADLEARNIELEAMLVTKEEEGVLMSAQIPANAGILDVPIVTEVPAKGVLGVIRKYK